ncbi:uncharacterized protein K460DRAFT_135730 [Cucurbitaria berberidis CBS 394.84]|uniref:Uncharacterized protein n=1 Tax=Cucurbitaria berberidis CBS 394.84 TaxID=1168544 RepID=A0A9P4GBM6_9PLEO|nr:uncharacterized protein K460DRAFT_135730 [Cucurbitaria berberidis CBS 394.84]KAF1842868.1 hypothetical protein K460DRAFT_135730 [Cucurbitaria berberidis CBS 394.84]
MRYTITAFAAFASIAAYPASSKTPEVPAYPASSKTPEVPAYPASSKTPEVPAYPASSKTPEVPAYPASSKPSVPEASTSCSSSTTITVTVPYPTGTGYPVGPGSKPSGPAPYPIVPGTGVPSVPAAGTGYPTKTGGYSKPSTPAEFTGAASALNAAGFVAGVGAIAAFFL